MIAFRKRGLALNCQQLAFNLIILTKTRYLQVNDNAPPTKSTSRTCLCLSKFRMSSSYTPGSKHNQPRVCLPFSGASSCFGTPCPFGFYGPAGEGTSRFQRRSQIQCFNVAICSAYARAIETLKCDACEHDLLVVGADRTPWLRPAAGSWGGQDPTGLMMQCACRALPNPTPISQVRQWHVMISLAQWDSLSRPASEGAGERWRCNRQ